MKKKAKRKLKSVRYSLKMVLGDGYEMCTAARHAIETQVERIGEVMKGKYKH